MPMTSKTVLEDVFEAKNILEDSNSDKYNTITIRYQNRVKRQGSRKDLMVIESSGHPSLEGYLIC